MCVMDVRPLDPEFQYPKASHIRPMTELPSWVQRDVMAAKVCTGRWTVDGAKDDLQWHSKE